MSTNDKIQSVLRVIYPNGVPVEELGRASEIAAAMQSVVQQVEVVAPAQEANASPPASINNSAVLPTETANRTTSRTVLGERILKMLKKNSAITELGLARKFGTSVDEIRAELKELGFEVKNGSPRPGWGRMVQGILETGPATTVEIADALNVDTICVNRGITVLERSGLIDREPAGKNRKGVTIYRWSLKK